MIIRRSAHNTYYSHGVMVTRLRYMVEQLESELYTTTGIVVDTDSLYIKLFRSAPDSSAPGNTSMLRSRLSDDIRIRYHDLKYRGSKSTW